MKATGRYNPNNFNALHAGIAYAAYLAVFFAVGFVFRAFFGEAESWYYYSSRALVLALCVGVLVAVLSLFAGSNPVDGGGYLVRKGCGMEILMSVVFVAGMTAVFLPLAETFASDGICIRTTLGISAADGLPESDDGAVLYAYLLLPLLSAVFEELLFRGVILRGLSQWGKVPAVLLSSLAFSLAYGNPFAFLYRFLLGLALGFLFTETKNLFVPVAANFTAAHFIGGYVVSWERIAYLFAVNRAAQSVYESIIGLMSILIGVVCLIAGGIYFGKRTFYSKTKGEKTRSDVRATYVVGDDVSGTQFVEDSWYVCGELVSFGEEPKIFLRKGKGRGRVNGKSPLPASSIVLACAVAFAAVRTALAFFGI